MTSSHRIGRYIRVSKQEQRNGLDRQLFRLEKCVLDLGGTIELSPLWFDVQSGRENDRTKFQEMLTAIKDKKIDILIVYRLDRLARDVVSSMGLIDLFTQSSVRLFDFQKLDYINFANPEDWASYAHRSVEAEAESRRLSKRIKDGWEYSRLMGKASSKPPWGYIRNKETERYELDPDLEKAVRDCVKIILECGNFQKACRTIARRWGKQWEYAGFRSWIQNPVLRGHTGYGKNSGRIHWKDIRYNTHPEHAVLSDEELNVLLDMVKTRQDGWNDNVAYVPQPLSGVVYCGRCGGKMVVTRGGNPEQKDRPYYFSCRERSQRVKPEACTIRRSCPVPKVEDYAVSELIKAYEALAAAAQRRSKKPDPPEVLELKRTLKGLEKMGTNSAIEQARSQITMQIAQLQAEQGKQTVGIMENRQLLQAIFADPLTFTSLPPDEKRRIYNGLISKVLVDCREEDTGEISRRRNPKMLVHWNFQIQLKPLGI